MRLIGKCKHLFLACMFVMMLILGSVNVSSTYAATREIPSDITYSDWAKGELEKAQKYDLIPESITRKDYTAPVTRKEFCAISLKLYESLTKKSVRKPSENPFEDTDDVEILKAYKVGITNGTSETTFSPERLISREQMATMIARALDKAGYSFTPTTDNIRNFYQDANDFSEYASLSIYSLDACGIMNGVGQDMFNPKANATIEQAIIVSVRAYEFYK